jgi:uncharacterized protein YndB with AHSA1/START domain
VPELTIKHHFAAAAERVYEAWLDPEQVRRFLFTTATGEIVRCEIDARRGGKYVIVDRRNGEDVLHEGNYVELERPTRIVFTLRVPKYSSDEDRVRIELHPRAHGCDLTLRTRTSDEWKDDTQRGWAMMLDVLDEILPVEVTTCGAGLAQHATVSRRSAIYLAELAETLDLHRALLVRSDADSRREDDVYRDLATSYREIATMLQAAADRMSAQRDVPMGAHDESRWTETHLKAFARFVHEQDALASVLRVAATRDGQMLASMQMKPRPAGTNSTRLRRHIHAPRSRVYDALLDPEAIVQWKVPDGMTARVHAFDRREGGEFRISLTYDAPTTAGKTSARTDTYFGRFVKLVPNERVVEIDEFETDDPSLRGSMTISITLSSSDGGTELLAVHEGLPSGLSSADNETGWRMALDKLAALVEAG